MLAAWAGMSVMRAQSGITVQPELSADWTRHYAVARGKALGGLQRLSPNLNAVVTAHLQPWARVKMEATDGVADDTGQVCQPIGIFRYAIVNAEFLWLPGPDKITIAYWEINTVGARRIYLNRPHARNASPSWNGDSVGHWEGDALIRGDTVGFNDKSWLHTDHAAAYRGDAPDRTYPPHHHPQRGLHEVRGKIEDRQALTSAFEYSRYYKQTSEEMTPNVCSEDIQTWKSNRDQHLRPLLERAQGGEIDAANRGTGCGGGHWPLRWRRRSMRNRGPSRGRAGYQRRLSGDPEWDDDRRRPQNEGSPADISLLPAAAEKEKTINLKDDPAKMCQPVGPFRMMARPQAKVELMPATGMVVMLFEDLSRGLMRTIYTTREHRARAEATWMGDSTGRWEGDAFVVDTVGFNDHTWLNDHGALHSDALHLVERIRPLLDGKYLEYKVTAEDAKALAKSYSYTRYYEKLKTEVMEDICEDEP